MELNQRGGDLIGTIDFRSFSGLALVGYVSNGPGISGSAERDVSVRLIQRGTTLTGMIVSDTWQQSLLTMSKRYDVVTPLQRAQ